MVGKMSRDHLADDAAVTARNMGDLELRAWRKRLTCDIVAPGYGTDEDNALAVTMAETCLREVDRELARRDRASRLNSGVHSPFDRRTSATLELAAALKERVTVPDYLATIEWRVRRVGRDKRGRDEHSGPCPMCNEGDDRFVSWGLPNSTYWCRVCGAKGDVITMIQQREDLDFAGAVRELAILAGVEP